MMELMQGIKAKADKLALMNVLVDIEELTIKILNGLDESFKERANAIEY